MSKVTLRNITNLENQTTVVATINANNAAIQTGFDNTLSRSGLVPNSMTAALDMNSFNIINLPAPATAHSPLRLADLFVAPSPDPVITNNINFYLSQSPIFDGNINSNGLNLTQFTGGNPAITSDYAYNRIVVANDGTVASNVAFITSALSVELDTGGPNINNEKAAARFLAQYTVPGATNPHDLIGIFSVSRSTVNVGGTNTGAGAKGTIYGINPAGQLTSGATNFVVVSSGEHDVAINTGASASHRWGMSIISLGDLNGAVTDGAVQISSGGTVAFKNAILLSSTNGGPSISTDGNVIGSDGISVTAQSFVDLTNYTFTSYLFNFQNFSVDRNGRILATTLATTVPTIVTGASANVSSVDSVITVNHAGTVTLTLPDAAGPIGRWLTIKTVTANTVVSASSNVIPQIGGATGTAILAATAGKWAKLQSNGTNWEIMESN